MGTPWSDNVELYSWVQLYITVFCSLYSVTFVAATISEGKTDLLMKHNALVISVSMAVCSWQILQKCESFMKMWNGCCRANMALHLLASHKTLPKRCLSDCAVSVLCLKLTYLCQKHCHWCNDMTSWKVTMRGLCTLDSKCALPRGACTHEWASADLT